MSAKRHIILGISGSIAAYKAVTIARLLTDEGCAITPVLTHSATRFVGPMSFSVICGQRAITNLWSQAEAGEVGHIELAHRADVMLIAPCTADLLARLAMGRANDPLTAMALSTPASKIVAPAMETGMWYNPATQENIATLRERGYIFVPPAVGHLASGRHGMGRMAQPRTVADYVCRALSSGDLNEQRILVTAGPTQEQFDPVRFLSNRSSGKMGYALARQAWRRDADVTLISGPTHLETPTGITRIDVATTQQMLRACNEQQSKVIIMAAAPADYRPQEIAPQKIKKTQASMPIDLERTPDILESLDKSGRVVIGFAAETEDLITHATAKLKAKQLDLVVANNVARTDAGFGSEHNAVTIVAHDAAPQHIELSSKDAIANAVLDRVVALLPAP